jgi:hypothetical protein
MKKFVEILNKMAEMFEVKNDNNRELVTMMWLFGIYTIVTVIAIVLGTTEINIVDNDIGLVSSTMALLGYSMYITKIWTIARLMVEEETKVIEG